MALTFYETSRAARGAADAADAARASVDLAKVTAERELRAYVSCTGVIFKDVAAGKKPKITVVIENFGGTPADEASSAIAVFLEAFPQTVLLATNEVAGKRGPIGILDSHNKVSPAPEGPLLTEADIADITERRKALYVVTGVRYRDVFGKRCYSQRWFMFNHRNIAEKLDGAHVCLHGNTYEFGIREGA